MLYSLFRWEGVSGRGFQYNQGSCSARLTVMPFVVQAFAWMGHLAAEGLDRAAQGSLLLIESYVLSSVGTNPAG